MPANPVLCMSARVTKKVIYVSLWILFLASKLVVPISYAGTIPFFIRQHADVFVGAAFDAR
jgi:hypothetical protein